MAHQRSDRHDQAPRAVPEHGDGRESSEANTGAGGEQSAVSRRVFGNFARLLGGRTVAAVLLLAATGLTARFLPPADFGIVVMLHAGVGMIRGVLSCGVASAVVRFGVAAEAAPERLASLLGTTLKLDIALAVSGAAIAVGAAPLAARALDWPSSVVPVALLYGGALILSATGTAKGLLRLADRFATLATGRVIGAAIRLVGVAVAIALDSSLAGYAAAWAAGLAVEGLFLLASGLRELRRRSLSVPVGMGRRGEHPGLGRYLVIGWWQSSLELVPRQLSTLLAGALLGSTGAGLFQLARDVANVLARPALMLRQAALPDLARVWHAGGRSFVAATLRLSLVMAGPALALVALVAPIARPGLTAVFGPGYATAAPLLMLLLLAASLELAAAPLRAAAYAMGRPGWILTVQAVATILYLALFMPLAQIWGLVGAGIAALALAAIFLGGLFVTVLRAPPTDAVLASPR